MGLCIGDDSRVSIGKELRRLQERKSPGGHGFLVFKGESGVALRLLYPGVDVFMSSQLNLLLDGKASSGGPPVLFLIRHSSVEFGLRDGVAVFIGDEDDETTEGDARNNLVATFGASSTLKVRVCCQDVPCTGYIPTANKLGTSSTQELLQKFTQACDSLMISIITLWANRRTVNLTLAGTKNFQSTR
jgi:hypothetical protein